MNIWLDAHLSPALASWINARFEVTATPLRDLGLRDSPDREVFLAARKAGAVVMTTSHFKTFCSPLKRGPLT